MDPVPLIHNFDQKPCSDVSHVIQEVFQTTLEQEVFNEHRLANLELSCDLDDEIKDIFKKICSEHQLALEHTATLDEQLMKEHTKAVIENKYTSENKVLYEENKLKTKPWNGKFYGDLKEYLIQPNDLLPSTHEQYLDYPLRRAIESSGEVDIEDFCHIKKILKKQPSLSSQPYKNPFEMKHGNDIPHIRRYRPSFKNAIIFQALPSYIEFTDYQIGVKYEKTFKLKNISSVVGRFEILPLPKSSKFHINLLPGITKTIAPGLFHKVKVTFCTDSLENVKEQLNISVDGGWNIIVPLYANRETTKLKEFQQRETEGFSSNIKIGDTCYISNNVMKRPPLPPIQLHRILSETEHTSSKIPSIGKHRISLKTGKIFEALPSCIEFTDYQIGVKYEKIFNLKNISNTVGRFQLIPLPKESKFHIEFDLLPGITKMVAPGLSIKIKVVFCTDSLEDEKELLNISVYGGRRINVLLLAYREAPQLKVIELLNAVETSLAEKERVLCTTVECGQCLVGDTVTKTIRLHNSGGGAHFWLISENDWCSAKIMDFTTNNAILLPPFTISPSYFTMSKGGVIDINIKFLPMTFGLHTEKLYVMCNNCSFRELDLIGDGFCYEDYFLTVENLPKIFQIDIEDDLEAEFYLDLGKITPNGKAKGAFNISNNSPIELQYIWRSRQPNIKCPAPPNFNFIAEEHIYIEPEMGHFLSKGLETFTVFCNIKQAEIGHYRYIFQLYINNLPPESLSKSCHPLKIVPNKNIMSDREGIDILIKEVEIWIEVVPINISLDPCIINITGNKIWYDEQPLNREVNIRNRSDCPLTCVWEMEPHFGSPTVITTCFFSMKPSIFRLYPHSSATSTLNIKIVNPGKAAEKFRCIVNRGEHVLKLSIEIEVDDQVISPSTHLLNFGLVKYGTLVKSPLAIISKSSFETIWKIEELRYNLDQKVFQHLDRWNLSSDKGFLCHAGSYCDLIYYLNTRKSGLWGSLLYQTIISSEGKISPTFQDYILVIGDIIKPRLQIQAPMNFNAILTPHGKLYLGIEVQCYITLKNLTRVSASFSWEMPFGMDANKLEVKFDPENGVIPGAQSTRISVNITPKELGLVKHYYVTCTIGRVQKPIVLGIEAEVGGLSVNFHIPLCTEEGDGKCLMHQIWSIKDMGQNSKPMIFNSELEKSPRTSDHEIKKPASPVNHSDLNVKSKFSSVEFDNDSGSKELKKSIGTKMDSEVMNDNLKMTVYFSSSKSNNNAPAENIDVFHVNELPNANSAMNEFGHSNIYDEFPVIDFTPAFPLSSQVAIQLNSHLIEEQSAQKDEEDQSTEQLNIILPQQDISLQKVKDHDTESGPELARNISKNKKYSRSNSKNMQDALRQSFQNIDEACGRDEDKSIEDQNTGSNSNILSDSQMSLVSVHSSENCTSYKGAPFIYFCNLPCYEAVKKTLVLQNETPIPSKFTISIANFYAREHVIEPSMVEQIQMKIAGKKLDRWKYQIREKEGIVFTAEPVAGELGPHEVIYIDIWAYADTWGTYTDQIICQIIGLAPFIIGLEAQVTGFPLSFPMSHGSIQKKTILRFGVLDYHGMPQKRRVRIKNESSVNISVNWHIFIEEENNKSQQPFTLTLDIFDSENVKPISGKASIKNHEVCEKEPLTPQEMKLNITPYYGREDFRIFQRVTYRKNLIVGIYPPFPTLPPLPPPPPHLRSTPGNRERPVHAEDVTTPVTKHVSMKIRPGDINIPSKSETSVFIKVNPKICNPCIKDSLHLKAVAIGYLRISELDSRKEGYFVRPSGLDMEPVILHMEATIEIPLFTLCHTKEDAIFRVNAIDVMSTDSRTYTVDRTLRFNNDKQTPLSALIETTKPFEIFRIRSLSWNIKHQASKYKITLNSGESAEIQVGCIFDRKIIDQAVQILKENSFNILHTENFTQRLVTFKGELYLKQQNLLQQIIHLNAHVIFPNLILHTEMLDFGPVFVKNTKQLHIVIQNRSAIPIQIHLAKKFVVEEYRIETEDLLLPPATATGKNITEIAISFTPSDPKEYMNKIEIQNCIPGDILEVSLTGVGTINEKFNMKG